MKDFTYMVNIIDADIPVFWFKIYDHNKELIASFGPWDKFRFRNVDPATLPDEYNVFSETYFYDAIEDEFYEGPEFKKAKAFNDGPDLVAQITRLATELLKVRSYPIKADHVECN